ncbi:MAG: hypothetical protein EZS28_029841, partial [Streblomastix strix]
PNKIESDQERRQQFEGEQESIIIEQHEPDVARTDVGINLNFEEESNHQPLITVGKQDLFDNSDKNKNEQQLQNYIAHNPIIIQQNKNKEEKEKAKLNSKAKSFIPKKKSNKSEINILDLVEKFEIILVNQVLEQVYGNRKLLCINRNKVYGNRKLVCINRNKVYGNRKLVCINRNKVYGIRKSVCSIHKSASGSLNMCAAVVNQRAAVLRQCVAIVSQTVTVIAQNDAVQDCHV